MDVQVFVTMCTSLISLSPGLCAEDYRKLWTTFAQS